MQCIFCLKEQLCNKEHVFPFAIGGRLTIQCVCQKCNSDFGGQIDAALTDDPLVLTRRSMFKLAGQSGVQPTPYNLLTGVGRLAHAPERQARVIVSQKTQAFEVRAIYHASDIVLPNGSTARQIVVDEADHSRLAKTIERERRRNRLPALTSKELALEIERIKQNCCGLNNSSVVFERTFNFGSIQRALAKIAYELAFFWLGDGYVNDFGATDLRAAIWSGDVNALNKLPIHLLAPGSVEIFNVYPPEEKYLHLAYTIISGNGLGILVKVFDIYAAFVHITKEPGKYLTAADFEDRGRVLAIDPATKKVRQASVASEVNRIVQNALSRQSNLG